MVNTTFSLGNKRVDFSYVEPKRQVLINDLLTSIYSKIDESFRNMFNGLTVNLFIVKFIATKHYIKYTIAINNGDTVCYDEKLCMRLDVFTNLLDDLSTRTFVSFKLSIKDKDQSHINKKLLKKLHIDNEYSVRYYQPEFEYSANNYDSLISDIVAVLQSKLPLVKAVNAIRLANIEKVATNKSILEFEYITAIKPALVKMFEDLNIDYNVDNIEIKFSKSTLYFHLFDLEYIEYGIYADTLTDSIRYSLTLSDPSANTYSTYSTYIQQVKLLSDVNTSQVFYTLNFFIENLKKLIIAELIIKDAKIKFAELTSKTH